MEYKLRLYHTGDKAQLIEIFNYFVEHSFAAFNIARVPGDYLDFLFDANPYPVYTVVMLPDNFPVGFGLIHPHHRAESMAGTAELTYFILPGYTRQGLGQQLLKRLFQDARNHKLKSLLACISSLNKESIVFHLKHGFKECGRFREAGEKFNRHFDLVWMQRFV